MTSFFSRKSQIVITCPKGIPPFLKEEVRSLHLPVVGESVATVETEGTMEDAMRLNLFLRTGHRVLFFLEEFKAENPHELYKGIHRIPWEEYIAADEYLCVTADVDQPTIRDSRFANLKVKDGIVDRLREKYGRRPDSGPERTGVVVDLYWVGRRCRVYIDTSGEPLPRRGYRKIPFEAPMQETLAAAVILASGWKGQGNFVNPMCGSGTLAIEAALIARSIAPGLLRTNYGFMHLKGFPSAVWMKIKEKVKAKVKVQGIEGNRIIATDISPRAIEAARKNAAAAGVSRAIEFRVCDFAKTPIPEGGGVVLLNPEYGERMGDIEKLGSTYHRIGDFFKNQCQGYTGYIFTGNLELAKKVGLRTKRRIPFFNSNIECRLLEFDLYEGSRKNPPSLNEII